MAQERVDALGEEQVVLRAEHDPHPPAMTEDGDEVGPQPASLELASRAPRLERSEKIASLERSPLDTADEGADIGGATAGEERDVDSAGDGKVGPCPAPRPPKEHLVIGPHPHALPHRERLPVERRLQIGAGDRDHRLGMNPEPEPGEKHLDAGRARTSSDQVTLAGIVADQEVGDPEGEAIGRT